MPETLGAQGSLEAKESTMLERVLDIPTCQQARDVVGQRGQPSVIEQKPSSIKAFDAGLRNVASICKSLLSR